MGKRTRAEAGIVDAIYDAVTTPGRWPDVLARVAAALDADSGAIFYLDRGNALGPIEAAWGRFSGDAVDRYKCEFAAIDPAPAVFARVPIGTNSTTNRLFSSEMIGRDPFFHEFYARLGLDETLGGTILRDERRIGILGIHRGGRRRWFSDGDLRFADALMPHLARALQLHRQFGALAGVSGALARFVDEIALGVIVLDAQARAVHVNRAAAAIVARGDGLRLDARGRPAAGAPEAARALGRLVAEVTGPARGAGGIVSVPRHGGRPPYMLLVAPQGAGHGFARDATRGLTGGALVLVHDPDGAVLPLPAMLRRLYGFTAREAELAASLAAGLRLADIAEQQGTSLNTLKFHLKSIYLKTDTNTQAALVRKIATALAGLGGDGFAPLWSGGAAGRFR